MTFTDRQAAAWTQIREQFDGHLESVNGPGSFMAATQQVREALPVIIDQYEIKTMLDAPCGDQHWMQHVDLSGVQYMGWDVEPEIVARNRQRFPDKEFDCINLLTTTLAVPRVDLILCRDFTLHLPNRYIQVVLRKFINSGSRYLLTTNWPGAPTTRLCDLSGGEDDRPGYYCQPVDLEMAPFSLPGRLESFVEDVKSQQEMVVFDLWES